MLFGLVFLEKKLADLEKISRINVINKTWRETLATKCDLVHVLVLNSLLNVCLSLNEWLKDIVKMVRLIEKKTYGLNDQERMDDRQEVEEGFPGIN